MLVQKKIFIRPLEELLGPPPNARKQEVTSSNIENEDSEETKQMIMEAESVARESKLAMSRILKVTEDTQQVAANTLEKLDQQTEQIKRIQDDIDKVEFNLDRADRELRTIGSVFGQVANAFTPNKLGIKNRKGTEKMDKVQVKDKKNKDKKRKKDKNKKDKEDKKTKKLLGNYNPNGNIPKEIGVLSEDAQQDVKDVDDGLNHVGNALTNLKGMAMKMGDEIEDQNKRLEKINKDQEHADLRIRQQKVRVMNLT